MSNTRDKNKNILLFVISSKMLMVSVSSDVLMCGVMQVMRVSAASCWLTTASLSPADTEPPVSAAWQGPGATVPKVKTQLFLKKIVAA